MKAVLLFLYICLAAGAAFSQEGQNRPPETEKAEAVLKRAVATLGGDRYLRVKSVVGRGRYSTLKEGMVLSFQSFLDILVHPDKQRTEFKGKGSRTIQVNTGNTGSVYDGDQDLVKAQNDIQVGNYRQGLRTSIDHLLRGAWRGDAELSYLGRRPATLGKRNDVVKLTYKDGYWVEFEFAADDALPQKAIYQFVDSDGAITKGEDRYAQFIDIGGIKTPFIIDRLVDGAPASRVNYETVEFDRAIPDSVFAKPSSPKEAKKEIKF